MNGTSWIARDEIMHSGPSVPFPRQRTERTARPGAPRSFVTPIHDVQLPGPGRLRPVRTLVFLEEPHPPLLDTGRGLVEADGIEPTTPCLQSRCSPS